MVVIIFFSSKSIFKVLKNFLETSANFIIVYPSFNKTKIDIELQGISSSVNNSNFTEICGYSKCNFVISCASIKLKFDCMVSEFSKVSSLESTWIASGKLSNVIRVLFLVIRSFNKFHLGFHSYLIYEYY